LISLVRESPLSRRPFNVESNSSTCEIELPDVEIRTCSFSRSFTKVSLVIAYSFSNVRNLTSSSCLS